MTWQVTRPPIHGKYYSNDKIVLIVVEAIRRVCVENGRGDLNSHTIVPIRGERTQPNTKRSKKRTIFLVTRGKYAFEIAQDYFHWLKS